MATSSSLIAYFGYPDSKIEVGAGDQNVPFTVVFANVGTQDITGIRGELGLPYGFSPSEGSDQVAHSDAEANSLAGNNFALVFFVNVDDSTSLRQYPGTVLVDYSRLRESGTRTAVFDFEFKLPGGQYNQHACTGPVSDIAADKQRHNYDIKRRDGTCI